MSEKADQKALIEEAWERVKEGLQEGTMTLPNRKQFILDAKGYLELMKWLAGLDKQKKALVSKPEDFNLKKTRG